MLRKNEFTRTDNSISPYILFISMAVALFILLSSGCKINPSPPDRYALVYGISGYDDNANINPLELTDDDARTVAHTLKGKGYTVYLRIDDGSGTYPYADDVAPATLQQFQSDLTGFAAGLGKEDLLLIYFSGHGYQGLDMPRTNDEDQFSEPSDEYLVFYPENNIASEYMISDTDFYHYLSYAAPKKRVVMIDACNSGGFIGSEYDFDAIPADYSSSNSKEDNILKSTLNAFFSPKTGDIPASGAIVISAAGESEESWEINEHGLLTYGFLYSVTHGDYDDNGYIDTGELYRYSRDYIDSQWNAVWQEYQFMPHISGGAVDYVLFKAD